MRRRFGRKGIIAVLLIVVVFFLIITAGYQVWGGGEKISSTAEIVELRSIRTAEGEEAGILSASAEGSQGGEGEDLPDHGPDSAAAPEPEHSPLPDSTVLPEVQPSPSAEPPAPGEYMEQGEKKESEAEGEPEPDYAGETSAPEAAKPEGINPSPAVPDVEKETMVPGGAVPSPAATEEPYVCPEESAGAPGEAENVSGPVVSTDAPDTDAVSEAEPGRKWKVTYYLPYIALSYDVDGIVYSDIREVEPSVYKNVDVDGGAVLDRPWNPIVFMTPLGYTTAKADISFEGWCTADGAEWDFEQDAVREDTELYPVWVDSSGKKYYTVIYSAPEAGFYCCNCLREGSVGYERPADWAAGYSFPHRGGYLLAGWEKTNQGNAIWGAGTEVVDGFESLSAVWIPRESNAYIAAYTTGTVENGYGDLADLFVVEPGGRCPAPARPLSDGIVLPEGAQGQPLDWLNENGSYRDIVAEGADRIYLFRAFWGMQGE